MTPHHPPMRTPDALLRILAAGHEPTQAEAARRADLSERSARRHLTRLEREGKVEVRRDGSHKRYRLRPEHRSIPEAPLALTEAEGEALAVAVAAARGLLAPTPFAAPLAAVQERLERAWLAEALLFEADAERELWAFDEAAGGAPPPFDGDAFAALLRAVRDRRPVVATYFTASRRERSEGRRLHPLGLMVRHGAWLLVARCCRDGRVKDFAVSGFEAVEVLDGESFAPPEGFDLALHGRDRFGALAGAEPEEVRLLVEPEAAPYFERKVYQPTQQVEPLADGGAEVSFEVEVSDALVAWCLSWGPKLRVLAPAGLAERVAEAHQQAAARYER